MLVQEELIKWRIEKQEGITGKDRDIQNIRRYKQMFGRDEKISVIQPDLSRVHQDMSRNRGTENVP